MVQNDLPRVLIVGEAGAVFYFLWGFFIGGDFGRVVEGMGGYVPVKEGIDTGRCMVTVVMSAVLDSGREEVEEVWRMDCKTWRTWVWVLRGRAAKGLRVVLEKMFSGRDGIEEKRPADWRSERKMTVLWRRVAHCGVGWEGEEAMP